MNRRVLTIHAVILLVLVFSQTSNSSLLGNIRKLVVPVASKDAPIYVSPSPSPVPSVNSDPPLYDANKSNNNNNNGSSDSPANSPEKDPVGILTDERCKMTDFSCRLGYMTACLHSSGGVPEEFSLLFQNGGESTLTVNGIISPIGFTFQGLLLPKNNTKKITLNATVDRIKSIVINRGCIIQIGAPTSEGNFYEQLSHYTNQVTPIHGVFLFAFIVLVIGGIWACCTIRRHRRESDGIPYQELEMGQVDTFSSTNIETAEDWDQDWGTDWDEEGVKSVGENRVGNVTSNGHSKSSSKDGWEVDWND